MSKNILLLVIGTHFFITFVPIIMFGTLLNAGAVVVGSLLGILLRGRLHARYSRIIMNALGLITIVLGVTMAIDARRVILVVGAMVAGSLVGEFLRLDNLLDRMAARLRSLVPQRAGVEGAVGGGSSDHFVEGFVTATLLFCVGSMAILGPMQEAAGGEPTILMTKSMMDGVSAMFFAASLGIGVMLSAFPVLIYQGLIALFASVIMSFMSEAMLTDLTATGGVLLIGLGISMLGIRRLSVINMLPALVVIVFLHLIF